MFKITHPITKIEIEVANQDLDPMTWEDAEKACNSYGYGWRLPSLLELETICKNFHINGIGNFTNTNYWSCTKSTLFLKMGVYDFESSIFFASNINNLHFVRPVRDMLSLS